MSVENRHNHITAFGERMKLPCDVTAEDLKHTANLTPGLSPIRFCNTAKCPYKKAKTVEPRFPVGSSVILTTITPGYEDEHPRTGATIHVGPAAKFEKGTVLEVDTDGGTTEYRVRRERDGQESWWSETSVHATECEAQEAFEMECEA